LQSNYRHNDLIIATRPYALPTRFDRLKAMQIAPLNPQQIEQFVKHYSDDGPAMRRLLAQLHRRHELLDLAAVPALLGFIVRLSYEQGDLVADRLVLYQQIVRQLVHQLDLEKLVERPLLINDPDGWIKQGFLRHLAFRGLFNDHARTS